MPRNYIAYGTRHKQMENCVPTMYLSFKGTQYTLYTIDGPNNIKTVQA